MTVNPNCCYSPAIVARMTKMKLFMVKLHMLRQVHLKCELTSVGKQIDSVSTPLKKQKWEGSNLLPPLILSQVSDNPKYKRL